MVTGEDLDPFSCCMGGPDVTTPPPGCDPDIFAQGDLDGDSDIDLHDVAQWAILVGQSYFAYGPHRDDREAEMLAMEVSRELRAPDAEYERIVRDLMLIRALYPELATAIDDADYVPNELLVSVDDTQLLDDYYALNEYYLVVEEEIHSFFRVLTFCDNLNMPELAQIYTACQNVDYADPNWMIGIDDFITIRVFGEIYRYSIDDGFWDCFDGCDCHYLWVIEVDAAGTVELISYREQGESWCPWPE